MKLLIRLFIALGLALVVIAFLQKFTGVSVLFSDISAGGHIVFANTCFLLALILRLAND